MGVLIIKLSQFCGVELRLRVTKRLMTVINRIGAGTLGDSANRFTLGLEYKLFSSNGVR